MSGGVGTFIQVLQPGQPINSFFVYQHRTCANGKPVFDTKAPAPTRAMYVDQNGDQQRSTRTTASVPEPAPKWILGHSSYLTYGQVRPELHAARVPGQLRLQQRGVEPRARTPKSTRALAVQPARLGARDRASRRRSTSRTTTWRTRRSCAWTTSRSATRSTIAASRCALFGTVQNAFTITGYSGVDPTAGLNGLDNNIYPRSRTFTGGPDRPVLRQP